MKKELVEIFDNITNRFVATDITLIKKMLKDNENQLFPQINVKAFIDSTSKDNAKPSIPNLNTEYKAEELSFCIYNQLLDLENSIDYLCSLTNKSSEINILNEIKMRTRALIDNQLNIHNILQKNPDESLIPQKNKHSKNFEYEIIKTINSSDKILINYIELQNCVNIPDLYRLFIIQNSLMQSVVNLFLLILIIN